MGRVSSDAPYQWTAHATNGSMHRVSESADNNQPPRRILLVSYWYPPAIGAAAERLKAFARHLPEHGWEVHVLTAGRKTPAPEIEGVTVHAVRDPLSDGSKPFPDYDPRQQPGRLKSFLRGFIFPDRFVKWRKDAYTAGRALADAHSFDVILASFPPASAVDLALRVHSETPARFVLDYRDRWFGPGGYEPTREKAIEAHRELEKRAISRADVILAVSEVMADAIADEYDTPRERIHVIPNGYSLPSDKTEHESHADSIDFSEDDTPIPTDPPKTPNESRALTIAHVGTVIARNRPDLFFEALTGLKGRPCLSGVAFKFVGNLSSDYVREIGLDGLIQTTGLIERASARREMRDADALLLLTGAYVGQWGHNAKLFEYIQAGRPVLCLEEEPGSNDRKLLEQFVPDRAFFAPIHDAEAIGEQIDRIRAYLANRPNAALELDSAFREYSRAAQTARLAALLDALIGT